MGETTTLRNLSSVIPESETQWRALMAVAYRVMNKAGHEALAKTHEAMIREIREGHTAGSSTIMHYCPQCRTRGSKVIMLEMGGVTQCGSCYYIHPKRRT